MPVPDHQSLRVPTLRALVDGAPTPVAELRARVAVAAGLTSEDVSEKLPSGQTRFRNRVHWALLALERAKLIARVSRAVYQITTEGENLLAQNVTHISEEMLWTYPAFAEWQNGVRSRRVPTDRRVEKSAVETPVETVDRAARELRAILEDEVRERIYKASPAFLERVVVDLLIKMGYGGGNAEMGRVTGRSGDGGVDGTIREDALGLDEVYIQAKRYSEGHTVGEPDLRSFAGAIDAAGTTKGVFVTTAGFTPAAREYVTRSPKRIVLIDGEELARLLVQHDVGVRVRQQYEIKRIDEDYFDENE